MYSGLFEAITAGGNTESSLNTRSNVNFDYSSGRGPNYAGFRAIYPLTEDSPLVVAGDLRDVYASQVGRVPEILDEESFRVGEDTEARIGWDDLDFLQGLHNMVGDGDFILGSEIEFRLAHKKGGYGIIEISCKGSPEVKDEFQDTYFIVDVGHAHLVGVAYELLKKGVDPSFVLHEKVNPRFGEALKYWARRYQKARNPERDIRGYATMVDCHRDTEVPEEVFPTADRLRELGVKRVVLLKESAAFRNACNPIDNFPWNHPDALKPRLGVEDSAPDIEPSLESYVEAGIPVSVMGIDNRQNRRFMPCRSHEDILDEDFAA